MAGWGWTLPLGHPSVRLDHDDRLTPVESPAPVVPASGDVEEPAAEPAAEPAGDKTKATHPDDPATPFYDARDDQGRFAPKE